MQCRLHQKSARQTNSKATPWHQKNSGQTPGPWVPLDLSFGTYVDPPRDRHKGFDLNFPAPGPGYGLRSYMAPLWSSPGRPGVPGSGRSPGVPPSRRPGVWTPPAVPGSGRSPGVSPESRGPLVWPESRGPRPSTPPGRPGVWSESRGPGAPGVPWRRGPRRRRRRSCGTAGNTSAGRPPGAAGGRRAAPPVCGAWGYIVLYNIVQYL